MSSNDGTGPHSSATQSSPSKIFEEMDSATLDLIIELQLEDIRDTHGAISDSELSLTVMLSNLLSAKQTISDRRMTASIANAVSTDAGQVQNAIQLEDAVSADYRLADQLNDSDTETTTNAESSAGKQIQTNILAKLAGRYVSEEIGKRILHEHDLSSTNAESDEQYADQPDGHVGNRAEGEEAMEDSLIRCIICGDNKKFFDVIEVECSHSYCIPCLRELFTAAMTDESLFPPRCCRLSIELDTVGFFLTRDLKETFQKKEIEFGTPNRTYCANKTCAAFINPDNIQIDVGVCVECGSSTCTICKQDAHTGDCPEDPDLRQTLDLARDENWQRCYSCNRMVELTIGCYHLTCHCRAEFCYVCGERWKNCQCPIWDERRLINRANVLVERDAPHIAPEDPEHGQLVQEAAQHLRDRHECDHTDWTFIRTPAQCEECHEMMPIFIFECSQCRIQACRRCRQNRL